MIEKLIHWFRRFCYRCPWCATPLRPRCEGAFIWIECPMGDYLEFPRGKTTVILQSRGEIIAHLPRRVEGRPTLTLIQGGKASSRPPERLIEGRKLSR